MNTKLTLIQSLKAGLIAGIVSALINAVVFYVFRATGTLHDGVYVQPPNQPLGVMPVLMASLVPSLIGSLVFFLIEKFTSNGYRIFTILTIILTVLSLASPFTVPINVTTGFALVLCLMHIVVPVVLLYFIGQALKQKQLA